MLEHMLDWHMSEPRKDVIQGVERSASGGLAHIQSLHPHCSIFQDHFFMSPEPQRMQKSIGPGSLATPPSHCWPNIQVLELERHQTKFFRAAFFHMDGLRIVKPSPKPRFRSCHPISITNMNCLAFSCVEEKRQTMEATLVAISISREQEAVNESLSLALVLPKVV